MKKLLLIFLIIPIISFGQTSLFYENPTEIIATKDHANTIGLSINALFLEDILENPSEYLNITIPFIDGTLELDLHKFSVVNDKLTITSKTSSRNEEILITPTVLSYKIFYKDKNIGVLNLVNNKIVATFTIDNKQYEISKYNNSYLLFEASNSINSSNFSCQVQGKYNAINVQSNLLTNVCVELAIEIDYYTRQTFNSDLEATNWALAIIGGVSQLYATQTNAAISVINILIWNTTDPHALIVYPNLLSSVKNYWISNNSNISRDLVHFMTKRTDVGMGGVAYLNGLCSTSSGYAWSGNLTNDTTYTFPNPTYTWNLMVTSHEIGHNFGANHTHWCGWLADPVYNFSGGAIDNCGIIAGYSNDCNPPAPPPSGGFGTIMSYCHTSGGGANGIALNFHDIVVSQALNPGISSSSCLTTCGEGCTDSLAFNYNPYSYIDNGTCCYISGCTDSTASNYNPNACIDDGICLFPPVSFCDDFESYQDGDPIAETSPNWETWSSIASPNPPYPDDADVTNTLASSGVNSLYFNAVGWGGPQDVVLPFGTGGPYTNGYFNFSANFYIINGAYFNFQAEQIPGITWTSEIQFNNSGIITVSNTNSSFSCNYTQGIWFEFKFEIDLTNNIWEVFIDGVSQGSFSNTINQIASLDLYPTQGDEFYVDDVCFEFSNTPIGQIIGCTDPLACNYDATANVDDGSCAYSTTGSSSIIACDSYTWNGVTYNTSGIYSNTYTNIAGCDSVHTLNLTINQSTINHTVATDCDSYTWSVDGNTYTQSGTYTNISTNSNGCDHTETLNLTINNSTSNSTTITDCDSYEWSVNGNTYNTSGTYTDVSTNSSGCTHTETLVLIINNSTSNTITITDCDAYIWPINNQTYTTSGVYTDVSTNSSGCTHTETLNLTLYYTVTDTFSWTACDSYTWDGTTYTTSGVYTNTYVFNYCDSIVTVTLTINSSNTGLSTVTACDSYTWDGIVYSQTGSYTNLYTNAAGCDSTHILDLTINDIYAINNTVDICYGDTLMVGNNIYTSSGIYNDVFSTVNGCDSIITTQLTVSSNVVSIISQTGVDLIANTIGGTPIYTYQWSTGETLDQITPTINGEYWVIVTDIDGCVSDTAFFTVTWVHTSIEDLSINRFIVYPNPTDGIVNIKFNDVFKGSIILENILGKLIFNKTKLDIEKNQIIQIDLSLFSKGVYFIRIANSNKIVNQKLILE